MLKCMRLRILLNRRPQKLARKTVEVILPNGQTSYHTTLEAARSLVASKEARWRGSQLILFPDRNIKISWGPRQSGYAGPLVMQAQT